MLDQLKTFGLLYVRPLRAVGRILDHGALGWAALFAVVSVGLLSLPWFLQLRSVMHQALAASPAAALDPNGQSEALVVRLVSGQMLSLPVTILFLMAAVYVPVSVLLAGRLEGSGSASVVLERDYMPALVCSLMAWSAALLPVAAVHWLLPVHATLAELGSVMTWSVPGVPAFLGLPSLVLLGLAGIYFLVLSVCVTRAVAGTGFARAVGANAGALVAALFMVGVYSVAGGAVYYLASPWVLYYLYMTFGSEVRSVGRGLSSRQRLRKLLETATVNPHDADAHYQLGLIYLRRHDLAQAKARFERALQIDPNDPDAQYQLGCILRGQGEPKTALDHLETAAAIDDKHASSEVWREIGAAYLDLEKNEHARNILRIYTARRPFDAEGLYWYGLALTRVGETKEARVALEAAIDAVRTAPSNRRPQIRQWESRASKQFRQLRATGG